MTVFDESHLAESPFLVTAARAIHRSTSPLVIPWPMPGNMGGFRSFMEFAEWKGFLDDFKLSDRVPGLVRAKFERSRKLYLLAWIDGDLIKAGELVAMTALELAFKDRYGDKVRRKNGSIHFDDLCFYVAEMDGLTDDQLPMNRRCRAGTVVGRLRGDHKPSIAEIRNSLAHGGPFDGLPWSGLLELVRDLIDFAYRDWPQDRGSLR